MGEILGGDDRLEDGLVEEREGEEEYVGPDIEHLRQMEGGDVVVFVAWDRLGVEYVGGV